MTKVRCVSCGYVQDPIRTDAAQLDPEPVPVAAPLAVSNIVQQARCPLCGELFDDPAIYNAHRAADCVTPMQPADEAVIDAWKIQCPLCGRAFQATPDLVRHLDARNCQPAVTTARSEG